MPLLSADDSKRIAQLRAEGFTFERWPKGVLVRDPNGSVLGLFGDVREWLKTLDSTGWPWGRG